MQEGHAIRRAGVLAVAVAMLAAFIAVAIPGTARAATVISNYRVTLENLTPGQPFSPPVAATHDGSVHIFEVGSMASDELAAIAQGGDQSAMAAVLSGLGGVTAVHDVGMPLTPAGSTAGGFSDTVEFNIVGDSSDVFSLAGMLICTNDGIAGVDSVVLPVSGSVTYDVGDYDAGREDNTEVSEDLVDPCSGLGPVGLGGDPDGNDDVGPATAPAGVITAHPNIAGIGELDAAAHGWTGPVASLTIELVPFEYIVTLHNLTSGQPFSPPVAATHDTLTHLFEVGAKASDELAAIAQGGDQSGLFALVDGLAGVTEAVDIGRPLPPNGASNLGFASSVVFPISGFGGDVFSLAGMLICTNDGIAGVDSVVLPVSGSVTYDVGDYDAGREDNTEVSEDLVDPCSGLGPVGLGGDPDGNDDVGPATAPAGVITAHPNIAGIGELDAAAHGWTGPVASLTISVLENAFVDDEGNIHEGDINASAAAAITKGSNPPANTEFSPDGVLTRGQAAAFFARALALPASATDFFTDDDSSIFEGDINAIAAAGITKGSNPPANTTYSPNDAVTRGQIAAMFARALQLPSSSIDAFVDDDGSIFEADINAIAAAGITKGSNPPANTMYNPNGLVTRAQLASMLIRALGAA